MGIEDIEKNNSLSEKHQEKLDKLFGKLASLAKSLTNSNEAYELAESIVGFKTEFDNNKENKKNGLKLENFLLGDILLAPESNPDASDSKPFDTEEDPDKEGDIEKICTEKITA